MKNDFERILFTSEDIKQIVKNLASRINEDYKGKELVLVCMLKGAAPFMMDLIKEINLPMLIDFMQISSYHGGTSSTNIVFKKDIEMNVSNKHVIIVDDILDTGLTMNEVLNLFSNRKVASIEACVLLDKPSGRKIDLTPKYAGAICPDEFIVGYGLDYNEYYRNLPFIGVLKKEIYSK